MTEDDFRVLAGLSRKPEISFMGELYEIRPDGLAALIRFHRGARTDDREAKTSLAVLYGFLEDCIIDFRAFEAAAMASQATMHDITPVINHLITWYCCRSHWPAMRLLGYASMNLEEIDGQLIRSGGRGITALSARELCDVSLAICLEGRNEDDREVFLTDLNYEGDAEADALAQLRQFQAAQAAAKAQAKAEATASGHAD